MWRKWRGPWPGNGPWSHLPPWERPGWRFGRGWCWVAYLSGYQLQQELSEKEVQENYPYPYPFSIYQRMSRIEYKIEEMEKEIKEMKNLLEKYKK